MAELAANRTDMTPTSSTGVLSQTGSLISRMQEVSQQPAVRRAVPTIVAGLVIIFGLIAYFMLQQPTRTTLYSSLPENEKSRVLDALTRAA